MTKQQLRQAQGQEWLAKLYSYIVLGRGEDYKKEPFSRILSDAVLKEHGFSEPTKTVDF